MMSRRPHRPRLSGKAISWALPALTLSACAVFFWLHTGHKKTLYLAKAEEYLRQGDRSAAREAYRSAYSLRGLYTPWVTRRVLETNTHLWLEVGRGDSALLATERFVRKHPKESSLFLSLAKSALDEGDLSTGFGSLENLLSVDTYHYGARMMLAGFRLNQGRPDLAGQEYRLMLQAHPDSLDPAVSLADVALRQGNLMEAKSLLHTALLRNETWTRARILLIDAYLQARELDSVQALLNDWEVAEPSLKRAIHIRKARIYALQRQYDSAEQVLGAYQDIHPDNYPALGELASIKAKKGHWSTALAIYETLARMKGQAAIEEKILCHLVAMRLGYTERALEWLQEAYALNQSSEIAELLLTNYAVLGRRSDAIGVLGTQPDSMHMRLREYLARLNLSGGFVQMLSQLRYYRYTQQMYQAQQSAIKLFEGWPGNSLAMDLYITELAQAELYEKALTILESLERPTLEQHKTLVRILFESGQEKRGTRMAELLLRRDPDLPGINLLLGDYYSRTDNAMLALLHFHRELVLSPLDQHALKFLAWEYGINQKDFEKAKPYLERLAGADSRDPKLLDTRGWIHAQNGNYAVADSLLQLAVHLHPDNPTILYHLSYTQMKLGRRSKAVANLRKALSLDRPFHEREQARELLSLSER